MPTTSIKTTQIKDDAVTFDKIQNATSESVLIGRGSGNGGGNYQDITLGTGLSISGTTLNASSSVSDGDKGDITVSGSGTTWTIDNSVVTGSKIATNTITESKIQSGAITNTSISNSAGITLSKLASQSSSQLVGTSSSSGTVTAITLGSGLTMSGTTLSASGGGGGGSYPTQSVVKPSNETIYTTNPTFAYDSHLSITVTTAGTYSWELDAIFQSAGGATRFDINGATSGTGTASNWNSGGRDMVGQWCAQISSFNTRTFGKAFGIAVLSAGATFKVGYYAFDNGNITLYSGSCLRIFKID
jgi:hypothetical protein